jgi:hypothetical protein
VKLRDYSDVNYGNSEVEKLLQGLNQCLFEHNGEEGDEMVILRFLFL